MFNTIIYASIKLTTENLTDEELNALYLSSLLGTDPRHIMGYDKAKILFTEDNGVKMHATTLAMFAYIWEERIGSADNKEQ